MDKETVDLIVYFIQGVGFPVVVACWLLFKEDKTIKLLTQAVDKLTAVVESCPIVKEVGNGTKQQ